MFFHNDIKGHRLPAGTVCLSYDDGPGETPGDGPGPHTRELGRYLAGQGIAATFFVLGRHGEAHRETLDDLARCGHQLGNHTYSHPGLVAFSVRGGDVEHEIEATDAVIRPFGRTPVTFFRAPYGNWREKAGPDSPRDKDTSVIADRLNRGGRFPHLVGPINWDVEDADWEHWRQGRSAEECARGYLAAVEQHERGIILMHDSSEDPTVRPRNQALQATRLLVPALRARGYRFVRLDEIPQVASATRVVAQVALRAAGGSFLSHHEFCLDELVADGRRAGAREAFGVVPTGDGRIALRANNGLYLSPRNGGGGNVCANATAIGDWEPLTPEPVGGDRIALKTVRGPYLAVSEQDGGRLLATAPRPGGGATFEKIALFR